jgi:hypothetical protein
MSKVLPSEWEAPEHLSLSEREFLVDRAETINGIIAASYLQVGQVLLQVKKKFKSDPELNGWFTRWVEETLPFSRTKATTLARIAEELEADPDLIKLVDTKSYALVYRMLCLPGKFKDEVKSQLLSGADIKETDIRSLTSAPEVELAAAQEMKERFEESILQYDLRILAASNKYEEKNLKNSQAQVKKKLDKAMQQLQEKQAAVDSLEKTRSTQEVVLAQLRKQLNQKQVFIENLTLDPNQNRQRDLAKTVVDATRALDMLLASFDRYSTDKTELGAQAIETIERKMDEVKAKLCECYARTT